MQAVLIGGAAGVIGLAIGFLVALSQKNKAVAEYEKKLDEARQKLEAARKEAGEHMEKERARAVDAERKLKETEGKAGELQKAAQKTAEEQKRSIAEVKGQLGQAQLSLTETEAARAKAVAQAETNLNGRTQAEGRTKQAEAHSLQLQKKIDEIGALLQTTQTEVETQKEAADRRAKEIQKLRAENASLKRESSAGLGESMEVFAGTEGSLEGTLNALMEAEGQKAAVLADANGIVVAAVGEKSVREGMAATSQLVGSMCTQLVDMVPFSSVRAYMLQDTQANVIAGRAFVSGGETVGLATYGQRVPSDRVLDGAMANLKIALE